MSIDNFTEKVIRNSILNKVRPSIKKSRSPHKVGWIYINKNRVAKVKIPNEHDKTMQESKSKYIARDLKLKHDQFNALIRCPLSGTKYYKILESQL